ncbi:hypothetical protein FQN54_002508 [Arachnomyces sp. PD_36]|nr:hypothetical protein FQN54_002508 [Arachnomyces sp. PD_36]
MAPKKHHSLPGNREGVDLLARNAQAAADIADLKATVKRLEAKIERLDGEVKPLKVRSEQYAKSDEGYRAIRSRFIETYRRGRNLSSNREIIQQGNIVAHEGDAIADASLYTCETNPRDDPYIMVFIYGIPPESILLLNDRGQARTIAAINEHATLEADIDCIIPVPNTLKAAFRNFCSVVKDEAKSSNLTKEEPSKEWTTTYNVYMAALDKHKRDIRIANANARRGSHRGDSSMAPGTLGLQDKVDMGDESKEKALKAALTRIEADREICRVINQFDRTAGYVFSTSGYRTVSDSKSRDWILDWALTRIHPTRLMENTSISHTTAKTDFSFWAQVPLFGRQVAKLGRSAGWTTGTVNAATTADDPSKEEIAASAIISSKVVELDAEGLAELNSKNRAERDAFWLSHRSWLLSLDRDQKTAHISAAETKPNDKIQELHLQVESAAQVVFSDNIAIEAPIPDDEFIELMEVEPPLRAQWLKRRKERIQWLSQEERLRYFGAELWNNFHLPQARWLSVEEYSEYEGTNTEFRETPRMNLYENYDATSSFHFDSTKAWSDQLDNPDESDNDSEGEEQLRKKMEEQLREHARKRREEKRAARKGNK